MSIRPVLWASFIISVGSAVAGCSLPGARVLSALPAVDSALDEREGWMAKHAALDRIGGVVLVLTDGSQIDDLDELATTVEADSPTARAVRAAQEAETVAVAVDVVSLVAFGVGATAMVGSSFFLEQDARAVTPLFLGGALMLASTAGVVVASAYAVDAEVQSQAAMITWETDTRKKLQLPPKTASTPSPSTTAPPPTLPSPSPQPAALNAAAGAVPGDE